MSLSTIFNPLGQLFSGVPLLGAFFDSQPISLLFPRSSGGGQQQQQNSTPAVPSYTDPSVQAAAVAQQTAAANARGRASTVLTGGQGDPSVATTQKKQLLGG